jgi:hypothetical protein
MLFVGYVYLYYALEQGQCVVATRPVAIEEMQNRWRSMGFNSLLLHSFWALSAMWHVPGKAELETVAVRDERTIPH